MNNMLMLHGYFGLVFYVVYTMLMAFIVINMFIAIMDEAFQATRLELTDARNDYELLSFVLGLTCVSENTCFTLFTSGLATVFCSRPNVCE